MIKYDRFAIMIAAAGLLAALTGCGGGSTNGSLQPQPAAGPVVYGLQPFDVIDNGQFLETSGLGPASGGSPAYVTAAVASTGQPLPAIAVNGTIPLGFAPGGEFIDSSNGAAVAPGASVEFGASLANGTDPATGQVPAIVPGSVILTSSEVPGFSQPLTFAGNSIGVGPLGNAQYYTGPFTLPFTTTGLHALTCSVADAIGQSSTTTFDVVVTAGSDGAVLAEVTDDHNNPIPGATASITNPIAGANSQTTSDAQGCVVLFAAPGSQTISVTPPGSSTPVTAPVTLTAGQITETVSGGSPLTIVVPTTSGSVRVKGHARR